MHGERDVFQQDPHWRDLLWFYEYFKGYHAAGSARVMRRDARRSSRPWRRWRSRETRKHAASFQQGLTSIQSAPRVARNDNANSVI